MSSRPTQIFNAEATAALLAASKEKDVKKATADARIALAKNPDIDGVDERNATSLYNAVENCNLALVNLLIERNANVNKAITLGNGFSPSMDPWESTLDRVYCSPLHCVAHADLEDDSYPAYKKIAAALIEAGASLKVRDVQSCTPRETAEFYGGISTLSRLMEEAELSNRAPDAEKLKAKKATSSKSKAG